MWLLGAFATLVFPVHHVRSAAASDGAPSSPSPPPYKLVRYEEDYSYLKDPARRTDPFDPIKYIPFEGTHAYLSLGGEIRERYEYFRNPGWGLAPQDHNGYVLQRTMLHGDLRFAVRWRFFGQIKSALENGREGGPRPADEDQLDLHQAFLEVRLGHEQSQSPGLRLGRQEISLGSSRLVSVREGPNVRRSFDGARLMLHPRSWRLDAFVTRPAETDRGVLDDGPDSGEALWGLYAVGSVSSVSRKKIDLYYLGIDRDVAAFDQGAAPERRHSLGSRVWGASGPWDWNFETLYQWGSFGRGSIRAWTAASDTGYTWSAPRLRPRAGFKANVASGDRDPDDADLQTFNALYPRGSYFSEAALIGPANFFDLHPSVELRVTERLSVTAHWDIFWRQSREDGVYGNATNLILTGGGSRERFIGQHAALESAWSLGRHLTLEVYYLRFFAGAFLRESGAVEDVDYVSAWVTCLF